MCLTLDFLVLKIIESQEKEIYFHRSLKDHAYNSRSVENPIPEKVVEPVNPVNPVNTDRYDHLYSSRKQVSIRRIVSFGLVLF